MKEQRANGQIQTQMGKLGLPSVKTTSEQLNDFLRLLKR